MPPHVNRNSSELEADAISIDMGNDAADQFKQVKHIEIKKNNLKTIENRSVNTNHDEQPVRVSIPESHANVTQEITIMPINRSILADSDGGLVPHQSLQHHRMDSQENVLTD